jgi:hypothetical protein
MALVPCITSSLGRQFQEDLGLYEKRASASPARKSWLVKHNCLQHCRSEKKMAAERSYDVDVETSAQTPVAEEKTQSADSSGHQSASLTGSLLDESFDPAVEAKARRK